MARSKWLLTAALALMTTVSGGCSALVDGQGNTVVPPHPFATPTVAAPVSKPADIGTTLELIAVKASDFTNMSTVRLAPGGAVVRDEVTMDNCGFDFTTEADRVARREYAVFNPDGTPGGLGNEVVAYRSPADVRKALGQWYTSAATCPSRYVTSRVEGEPPLRIHVLHNQRNVPTLPAPLNVLTVERATDAAHQTIWVISALQVHGRVLDVVFGDLDRAPSPSDVATVEALALRTGERLVLQS